VENNLQKVGIKSRRRWDEIEKRLFASLAASRDEYV
jgi:hypothetical protein